MAAAGTDAGAVGLAPGTRVLITIAAAVVAFVGRLVRQGHARPRRGRGRRRDHRAPGAPPARASRLAELARDDRRDRGRATPSSRCSGRCSSWHPPSSSRCCPTTPTSSRRPRRRSSAGSDSLGFTSDAAGSACAGDRPESCCRCATGVADSVLGAATAFFFVLAYVHLHGGGCLALCRGGQACSAPPRRRDRRPLLLGRAPLLRRQRELRRGRRGARRTDPVGARHPGSDRLGDPRVRHELHPEHRLRDRPHPAGDPRPGHRRLAARAAVVAAYSSSTSCCR